MFAIVNIKGSQYRVEENQKLYVPKMDAKEGDKVTFDSVLMTGDGDKFNIGGPMLTEKIEATVIKHIKDETVIVFKKKRRKGYKVRKGHRQPYTQISIDKIGSGSEKAPKKSTAKKDSKKEEATEA
ncbi:50S ribosomal protein L21 [soil metagenome]